MGGVSTWADYIVNGLGEFDFTIVSLVSNPHVEVRYQLPSNVSRLITLPLWGSDRPEEYNGTSLPTMLSRTVRTTPGKIKARFSPYYADFVEELLRGGSSLGKMAEALVEMKRFMADADYGKTMRSQVVWETFRQVLLEDPLMSNISTYQAVNWCRLTERYLKVLTVDVGQQDLAHCGIAGTVGLIGVIEKLAQGLKLVTTEHGIYFRERILDILSLGLEDDLPARILLINMYLAMVRLVLSYSDAIYPVCNFNAKWEKLLAGKEPTQVIPNGVDTDRFKPANSELQSEPKVVSVIRVERLKDPLTLVRAMRYVVDQIPGATCSIYGPSHDEDYARQCEQTVRSLGLGSSVFFMGFTREPEKAYRSGAVFVLPSISEGFPFALIEAMASGMPIVATDVGGVREALEGCGIVVPPSSPREMAEGIVALLDDRELALRYGNMARQKALSLYRVEEMLEAYRDMYGKWITARANASVS